MAQPKTEERPMTDEELDEIELEEEYDDFFDYSDTMH